MMDKYVVMESAYRTKGIHLSNERRSKMGTSKDHVGRIKHPGGPTIDPTVKWEDVKAAARAFVSLLNEEGARYLKNSLYVGSQGGASIDVLMNACNERIEQSQSSKFRDEKILAEISQLERNLHDLKKRVGL